MYHIEGSTQCPLFLSFSIIFYLGRPITFVHFGMSMGKIVMLFCVVPYTFEF